MRIPNDALCAKAMHELAGPDVLPQMTAWERSFVMSNFGRITFTAPQKETIATLASKYEIKALIAAGFPAC